VARRSWDSLSADYRARLTRNGVTPGDYSSGVSLSHARGHAKTPEHPVRAQRNPQRYPEYVAKRKPSYGLPKPIIRQQLEQQIMDRKRRLWGGVFKFRDNASDRNVRVNPRTKRPPSVADLEYLMEASDAEWETLANSQDRRWAILWYHS